MSSRVDALVISQVPPPFHGSTVMTVVLLDTLSRIGLRCRLIDRRFSRTVGDVGRFTFGKVLSAFWLVARLTSALIVSRPRLVIFFMTNRKSSFLVDYLLSEIVRFSGARSIGYIHTQGYSDLASRGPLWRILVVRLLGSAETLVCLSPVLEGDIRALAPSSNVVSIANTPYRLPSDASVEFGQKKTILYLSNLLPEKGIEEFFNVARGALHQMPDALFVAAGAPISPSQLAELRAAAPANLEIMGTVGTVEKWALLQRSRLLIFPSLYRFEAQPLTIIEAMAVGVPAIAFDIGGIGDIIDDRVNGRLVSADDGNGFVETALGLIRASEELHAMSIAARIAFQKKLSSDVYEEAWLRVLDR